MKTVCFMLVSDGIGGAENVVETLIAKIDRTRVRPILVINEEIFDYFRTRFPEIDTLNIGSVYPAGRFSSSLFFHARRLFDPVKLRIMGKIGLVRNFLKQHRCETISSHLMYDLLMAVKLKSLQPEIRVINSIHGLLSLDPALGTFVLKHREFLRLLSACDVLVSVSEQIQETLLRHLPECTSKSLVIENGVDTSRLAAFRKVNSGSQHAVTFVFCGGDKEVKGGANLQRTIETLASQGQLSGVVFHVLGPVAKESAWYSLQARFPTVLKIIGFQAKDFLYQEIASADYVLMPSLSEGHPIIALEALTLGVPVLASDIAAFRTMLPADQRFALSSDGLAKAIRQAVTDRGYKIKAASHACGFRAHDWASVAERYAACF